MNHRPLCLHRSSFSSHLFSATETRHTRLTHHSIPITPVCCRAVRLFTNKHFNRAITFDVLASQLGSVLARNLLYSCSCRIHTCQSRLTGPLHSQRYQSHRQYQTSTPKTPAPIPPIFPPTSKISTLHLSSQRIDLAAPLAEQLPQSSGKPYSTAPPLPCPAITSSLSQPADQASDLERQNMKQPHNFVVLEASTVI